MPKMSPYQKRQVRSALESQAQGIRESRHLGFDQRGRPVLQGLSGGKLKTWAVIGTGSPTAVTGAITNPAIYVTFKNNKYGIPDYVLCHRTGKDHAAHDTFRNLDDAMTALVAA